MTNDELTKRMREILDARNPFDWKRPDNIDLHPMRYHPVESAIEGVILTRMHQQKIDGYVLEMAVQISEIVQIAMTAARNEALEEAARKCEQIHREMPNNPPGYEQNLVGPGCYESARATRAMKASEP